MLKNIKILKKIILILSVACFSPIFSVNAASQDYPDIPPEKMNELVLQTFKKIGSNYISLENTTGFNYRYKNPLFNLYGFDLYIGDYGKGSLIRIESLDKTNLSLQDIFMRESFSFGKKNTQTPEQISKLFPYSHHKKSLFLGYLLTLTLPAAGSLYTNLDSAFSSQGSWLYSLLYLGIDGLLLWTGGTTFFTHSFDPFQSGLASTLILMGSYRVGHLIFNHISITANNRLVQLGYTFQFK